MKGTMRGAVLPVAIALLVAAGPAQLVQAGGLPKIEFDVGDLIACRDITGSEFLHSYPHEKLLEATFSISTLALAGDGRDVTQLVVKIESPDPVARVFDFLPRTELASSIIGPVDVQKTDEKNRSLNLDVTGDIQETVTAGAKGGIGDRTAQTLRYELLPPLELLSAAGTISRGHGVYFKLKPSPRDSLEGAREFVVVFRVPRDWRGNVVRIDCEAQALERGLMRPLATAKVVAKQTFVAGMYVEGDGVARQTVGQLVERQERLRQVLRMRNQHSANALAEWFVPFVDPFGDDNEKASGDSRGRLQVALDEVRQSKQAIHALNGSENSEIAARESVSANP